MIYGFSATSDLDCGFDGNLCKWINDGNNWLINWFISELRDRTSHVQRGLCLSSSVSNKIIKIADGKPLTARLWSPVIFSDMKLKCVAFDYRIEHVDNAKLTLMRREMGLVSWNR